MFIKSIVFDSKASTKLAVMVGIVFMALLFRNTGLYPIVFGDEFTYSQLSRLLPFSEAYRPNYLYYAVYGTTNICGDGFLECARILNVLFFVAAAPFIYLTGKRLCSKETALFVTLLALLGPFNSYTAYFMPESFYFFSFWLITWFLLGLNYTSDLKSWCFTGILLGLSALIKPHALFLLPTMVAYVFYISRRNEDKWLQQALLKATVLVVFTLLVKLLIGYLLAGHAGITIFGSSYSSMASSTTSDFQRYLDIFELSVGIVNGHILAISLMFGVPFAFATYVVINSLTSKVEVGIHQKVSFYTFAVLINLILVTGLFTASVAGSAQYETLERIHMRYYNFSLPLLIILAASQLSFESTVGKLRWRAVIAFPIGVAILYAAYTYLVPYTPYFVDAPELRGFTFNSTVFYVLSGISFISLVLWVYRAPIGGKIFLYFFMPLTISFSTFYVNQELRDSALVPDLSYKAGSFTKQFLSKEELSKLMVVGSEPAGLLKTLYYIDNLKVSFEIIPNKGSYDFYKLPPVGKEWVLILGKASLLDNIFFQVPMNGFTLVRAVADNTSDLKKSSWASLSSSTIDFTKFTWPGVISNTEGLSSTEAWGTHSSSDTVILKFSKPLPEKFSIQLIATAFGPNVGKEFVARVGDSEVKFTLDASLNISQGRLLVFNNPKRASTFEIDIPLPTSPKELGMSSDERRLGISLTELRITPI
jgi:phosphoglycerol transferase